MNGDFHVTNWKVTTIFPECFEYRLEAPTHDLDPSGLKHGKLTSLSYPTNCTFFEFLKYIVPLNRSCDCQICQGFRGIILK